MKKFIFLLVVMMNVIITSTCFAGAFAKTAGLPKIAVGEVASYGEHSLKQQFFPTFKELLLEQLQNSGKLEVVYTSFSPAESNVLSQVHMNAIVHSKLFVRERAKINLVRYFRSLDHTPKAAADVYKLDAFAKLALSSIDELAAADYVLFCDLQNAEVGDIHGTFNRGTRVKVEVNYYLVNKNNGLVYAETSNINKSSQLVNILLVRYGKEFTTEQILQTILEMHSEAIAKDITAKGIKKLK